MDEEFGSDEDDFDVYGEEGREELEEADEIDEDEEGFMRGYEGTADAACCDNCKAILDRNIVEKEIDGEIYTFCCSECVEEFERKRSH